MQAIRTVALAIASVAQFVLACVVATFLSFFAALLTWCALKSESETVANNVSFIVMGAIWVVVFQAWCEVTRDS